MTRGRRALVVVVIVLTATAGLQLFVLAEATASYFAWTVNPTPRRRIPRSRLLGRGISRDMGTVDG